MPTECSRLLAKGLALALLLAWSRCQAFELVEVVKKVENAVVRIDTDASQGSGAIVGDRGLIITNFHVIDGAREVKIELRNGTKLKSRGYLAIDPARDLAVIHASEGPAGVSLPIAAQLPSVGERVAAFGNPRGLSFSTTEGIVSAVRKGGDVSQAIGKEIYRLLGYSEDATWIQTSAAISPGNSGGPLVTMNAELVGLNTWSFTGQQLNFAISLTNINDILRKIAPDAQPQPYDTLPRIRSVSLTGDWYEKLKPFRLELPTGRIFSFDVFRAGGSNANQLSSAGQRRESGSVTFSHPNGTMYAAAQQVGGILHGLTVAQYDNQEPMVQVSYFEGRRHGLLKTWDEAGEPVFFCQYVQGRRDGFACLFEEGVPALIVQYGLGEVEYVQLMSSLTALEGFDSEEKAMTHANAKARLTRIEELDANLKKNEVKFRRLVKAYDLDIRRDLAAKQGPQIRDRMRERNAARVKANNEFFSELARKARGR